MTIRATMRTALKESLMKMKSEGKNERAKGYIKKMANEDEPDGEYTGAISQGGEELLHKKVVDAEEDGMADLLASSPSEYEGSDEEEASESAAEAKAEGDDMEISDTTEGEDDSWRNEQRDFMKGKSTAKPPRKSASVMAKGSTRDDDAPKRKGHKKIDPPFVMQGTKKLGGFK